MIAAVDKHKHFSPCVLWFWHIINVAMPFANSLKGWKVLGFFVSEPHRTVKVLLFQAAFMSPETDRPRAVSANSNKIVQKKSNFVMAAARTLYLSTTSMCAGVFGHGIRENFKTECVRSIFCQQSKSFAFVFCTLEFMLHNGIQTMCSGN